AKIASEAAGYNELQPNQMFQDVPVGSDFQVYIGRLASRGLVDGYGCGGPGEPCVPPDNPPYFRPNNDSTRGQFAKIASNTAGFDDTPTGQQFEDVSVGSTFSKHVCRLSSHCILSGYACGGQ